MNKIIQKLTAVLLALALTVSAFPVVYADEDATEPADLTVEQETVASEPISDEAPVEDSTEEIADGGIAESEPVDQAEKTEPVALPYGLTGMPEDYQLSEAVLAEKAALTEVLAKLTSLTPGTDYVENEVLTTAGSEEEAALIAAAFNGQLKKFRYGMVTITLQDCTVLEAVTAAAAIELPLPAVYPNYITKLEPIYSTPSTATVDWLPQEQTWETWVTEIMSNPDEFLWDPFYSTYQWHHDAVDTYAAWGVYTGWYVTVAVIDSGVDYNHKDLGGRVSSRDVGCGYEPKGDHGTHVAGIIAAEMDNGVGGAGIAPGASILSYCVADDYGRVSDANVIDAIYDAVDNGAWIINMSFGTPYYNYYVQRAINDAYDNGVTCIAAMGNDGTNGVMYPAAYDHVIAVTATDRSNNRAWFSNYGNWADVGAPGVEITSTIVGGGYEMMDGTSMAAPVVSGLAALYMSSVGWVSPDTMEKVLESSMVGGVVNAAKMFRGDKAVPEYTIRMGSDNYQLSDFGKNAIPCESSLVLWHGNEDWSGVILYTTDGKTPSVKNGQIVNGQTYEGAIDLSQFAGKTVTIKAARVTGMGVLSKVLTLKLKVAEGVQINGVSVEGSDTLVSGKSATFTATVYPAGIADQDVTWSIVSCSSAMKGATIDKKGTLKTVAGYEGSVTIRARSVADSRYYCDKTVQVKVIKPVAKVTVASSNITVGASYGLNFYFAFWDANGNQIDPSVSGVEFVSSNPGVVEVSGEDQGNGTGCIIGLKKGSATITVKALDGSGKSAKFKVTVTQPVESLSITGQLYVAPGSSATYKAAAYPSTANNKKVTWQLIGAPAGVTISSSGKVNVPSNVQVGRTFTVRARAADGYGAYVDYQVQTARKSTMVYVTFDNYSDSDNRPVWKNGSITSVELYTLDRPDYMSYDESSIILYGYGTNGTPGYWTCSSQVVTIENYDGYCVVRAVKPGTAKLTCTAQDGSGKKATVTVKVVTPSSRVSISTTAPYMASGIPYVAIGKSIPFKATLADTYGTPTNKSVTWDVSIYETYADGSINYNADWTYFFLSKKLCSISGGKLTVKSGVMQYWNKEINYDLKAVVYCRDAYGNVDSQEVYIIPPSTKLVVHEKKVYMPSDSQYEVYFECDQWNPAFDGWNNAFVATSSNPNVASVYGIMPVYDYYGNSTGFYRIIFTSGKPGTKGKATITIKATDSGKSAKITVNVDDKYW